MWYVLRLHPGGGPPANARFLQLLLMECHTAMIDHAVPLVVFSGKLCNWCLDSFYEQTLLFAFRLAILWSKKWVDDCTVMTVSAKWSRVLWWGLVAFLMEIGKLGHLKWSSGRNKVRWRNVASWFEGTRWRDSTLRRNMGLLVNRRSAIEVWASILWYQCRNCYSFIVRLEIWQCEFSNFILSFLCCVR